MNSSMKNNIKKISTVTIVSLCLSFVFSLLANEGNYPNGIISKVKSRMVGKTVVIDESRELDLSKIKKMSIRVGSSDVFVKKAMNDKPVITLKGKATGYSLEGEKILKFENKSGILVISIDDEVLKKRNKIGFTSSSLKIEVSLPSKSTDLDFELYAGSADLEMKGLNLKVVETKVGSGDVKIENCNLSELITAAGSGSVEINKSNLNMLRSRSGSGDVDVINSAVETVDSSSASGSISLSKGGKNLNLNTSSGDITVTTSATYPKFRANSASGNIKIKVVDKSHYKLSISTSSGDINTNVTTKNIKQTKRSMKADVGDFSDKGSIQLGTASGDITIL